MTSEDTNPGDAATPPPVTAATTDRGVSPIGGRLGGKPGRLITLAALGLGCGAFLFATWDRGDGERAQAEPADAARQLAPFEPARRASDPPMLADGDPDAPSLTATDGPEVPALEPAAGSGQGGTGGPSPAEQRRALAESAQRAPLLAYSRATRANAPAAGPQSSPPAAPADQTTLDQLRQSSPIGEVRAGRLPDRNLLITAGSAIPCILQTAMDSATPGYVACVISGDVYSDNGAVVLMERGTRVLGEYRGGVQQGRDRLFVLWTRAVTPGGVSIALASPAADALGRAGFDGEIDTHFWPRFGGALLLSILDDGLNAAAGGDGDFQASARAPSDAAAVALQNSVGITPTLRKAQGAEVSIFVAQDLNFAGVYRLRAR